MMTAIRMNYILGLILSFSCFNYTFSQTVDTLYVEYNKNMRISDFENEISLRFSLKSSFDIKTNTYNFKIDNLTSDFELLTFNQLMDSVPRNQFDKIKLTNLKELSEIKPCELHYRFSENKLMYLVKEKDKVYHRYKLIYWSTQRGWEFTNTH